MTGVSVLHQRMPQFNGTGIKVGIIDTGVDYTHEALGGCFGQGCRVRYGFDFADNDNDPMDWYVYAVHFNYYLFD